MDKETNKVTLASAKDAIMAWQDAGQMDAAEQERIIAEGEAAGITVEFVRNGDNNFYVLIPSNINGELTDENMADVLAAAKGAASLGSAGSVGTLGTFGLLTYSSLGSVSSASTVQAVDNSVEHYEDLKRTAANEIANMIRQDAHDGKI